MQADDWAGRAFKALTGGRDGGPLDLSDPAFRAEPGNFLRHVGALSLSKLADGLFDPKLVLSFVLAALGTPAGLIGLLVPVRESGALLPQLFTAPRIRAMGRRKWAWATGSLVQGVAAATIFLVTLGLSGIAAGLATLAALAVLAVARSVCSVSYKDVLGKTVDRTRRGTVTGLAGSVAAVGVAGFAALLMSGWADRFVLASGAIALAALMWLAAATVFATLREEDRPAAPDGQTALGQFRLLVTDRQLGRFVLTRCLLLPTALAPPYLVLLATRAGDDRFAALGAMVLASAAAGTLSAYVWGRMADRSSRLVLAASGALGALFLAAAVALDMAGLMGGVWAAPVILFGLMIAYQGVRLGRSTYLVDMAPDADRAAYTAVANTTVGLVLLAAGGFGLAASLIGVQLTLAVFSVLCLVAAACALSLDEA